MRTCTYINSLDATGRWGTCPSPANLRAWLYGIVFRLTMQKSAILESPSLVSSLNSNSKYCLYINPVPQIGYRDTFWVWCCSLPFSSFTMAQHSLPVSDMEDGLYLSYLGPVPTDLLGSDCFWAQPRTPLHFQYRWPLFLCTPELTELRIFVACPTVCWPSLLEVHPGHPWAILFLILALP